MEIIYNLINAEVNEEALQAYIEAELVGSEFLVTDEAGRFAALVENVKESLWAFNASFIMACLKPEIENDLSSYDKEQLEKSLAKLQSDLCEGANAIVKALIIDVEEFAEEAADVDGYGHFLSSYDGDEIEYRDEDGNYLYIYRLN